MEEPIRPSPPANSDDAPSVLPIEELIREPGKLSSGSQLVFWIGLLVFCLVYGYWLTVGGEIGRIAMAGLESIPILLLAVFAYGGVRHGWLKAMTGVYWALLIGIAAAGTWLLTLAAVADWSQMPLLTDPKIQPGRDFQVRDLFQPGALKVLLLSLMCLLAAFSIGAVCFAPVVRRLFAALAPMDPESFVHATALATVVGLTLISLVPLLILGGPPILLLLKEIAKHPAARDLSDNFQLRDQI